MGHQQPPVSEVTCRAAGTLASAAISVIVDGDPGEDQRAEAARLLRAAADMLTPGRVGTSQCRCSPMRGGMTVTTGDPILGAEGYRVSRGMVTSSTS